MPMILMLGCFFSSCNFTDSFRTSSPDYEARLPSVPVADKQRGMHVFQYRDGNSFDSLHKINVEWLTFVPYGSQDNIDGHEVNHYRGDSLQIASYDSSWVTRIDNAQLAGFKAFLKPHVWIDNPPVGKWRSDIYTEGKDWETWKDSYRDFIIRYARIAQRSEAEMFCIGAEFTKLSKTYPEYWRTLISEVRTIYHGKLTYAANWYQEYEQVTFWNDLDYVGIQAYFPLTDKHTPSVKKLTRAWNKKLVGLQSLSATTNRPILFTEMGYRSSSGAAIKPWEWVEDPTNNDVQSCENTQANCYQAFFNTIWTQEWFAGVHIWQWRANYDANDKWFANDFTPQGKAAEQIIKEGYR